MALNDDVSALSGQRALVTGGNGGIGSAVSRALARSGAAVAVNYLEQPATAEALVDSIRAAGGEAIAIHADVSREDQVRRMFRQIRDAWGTLDILVNNAGVQDDAPFHEMTLRQWDDVIRTNLTGQFLCSREAAREFIRRGVVAGVSPAAGKIVCISSVHDAIPWAGHINYAASKGGVSMLMKTMAQELAEYRIRVNAIAPGAIKTPINTAAWSTPEAEEQLLELIPQGRVGEVADVARAAVWLTSDASDYVTGHTLYVDGGMLLYPGFRTGDG